MTQYRIYLSDEENLALITEAKRQQMKPQDLIRNLVAHHRETRKTAELEARAASLEAKVEAVFALLDLVIGDIGYTAGATRAATKNHEAVVKEGSLQEERIMRTAAALKRVFRGETGGQHGL